MTAHCSVSTSIPVSALIAGSRMLTADVLALTTKVDRQVAASTPRAAESAERGTVPDWFGSADPADELVDDMRTAPLSQWRADLPGPSTVW